MASVGFAGKVLVGDLVGGGLGAVLDLSLLTTAAVRLNNHRRTWWGDRGVVRCVGCVYWGGIVVGASATRRSHGASRVIRSCELQKPPKRVYW